MIELLLLPAGILIGLLIAYFVYRHSARLLQQTHDMTVQNLTRQHEQTVQAIQNQYAQTLADRDRQYAQALADRDRLHEEMTQALQARFDESVGRATEQLKTATNDMLKARQQEFSSASTSQLGQIVSPLRETINQMKQAMENNTQTQSNLGGEMRANIQHMIEQSRQAKESADELARVFKHQSKVQGDWGELVLDELLSAQGLKRGEHYVTQSTLRDAAGNVVHSHDGASLRPDIILHLDQHRELIIDSKVSLSAFMDYVNAEDEVTKAAALRAHIESLQKHVKELAAKDYSSYVCPPKVCIDYVIMFVPHSGALWTALNEQPDLWRRAMERNVFIADEQTLFAAIRIVRLTWTQLRQNEMHQRVYALAEEMLDRVGQFVRRYEALGKALESAQKAYDEGQKKLDPRGQSILGTSAKLIQLGARQSTRNPIPQLAETDVVGEIE